MKTLPPEILSLQNGQTVFARWGRAGRNTVEFGKWQSVELYVQHRQTFKDMPAGPCVIAIKGVAWAEYDPVSDCTGVEDGVISLQAEDYYLEIKVLAPIDFGGSSSRFW